jgi:hypothetical protein
VCGLGLWTLLEKGDFIQLMANGTYQVSRTSTHVKLDAIRISIYL